MAYRTTVMEYQARKNAVYGSGSIVSYTPNQFDTSSGQCFAELTVQARRKRNLSILRAVEHRTHVNAEGCSTLEAMAMRQFLRYLDDVTQETVDELTELLSNLPWTVGGRIWKEAQNMDTLSSPLSVWRAFTVAYPQESGISYHCASIIRPDPDDLPIYLERMKSDTFSWLTSLTITDQTPIIAFRRPDIIKLSGLTNLVALDIGSTSTIESHNKLVDDTVIRAWSRHAEEIKSFRALQLLIIRNQPSVTEKSLNYLNSFPSLVLYGVQQCFQVINVEDLALNYGWTSNDEHSIIKQMKRSMTHSTSWDEPIHACYKAAATLSRQPSSAPTSAPFLNFRLGPVPKDVLFEQPFRPLIFFRCLRYTLPPTNSHTVPVLSSSKASNSDRPAKPQQSKRQRVMKSLGSNENYWQQELLPSYSKDSSVPAITDPPPRPKSEINILQTVQITTTTSVTKPNLRPSEPEARNQDTQQILASVPLERHSIPNNHPSAALTVGRLAHHALLPSSPSSPPPPRNPLFQQLNETLTAPSADTDSAQRAQNSGPCPLELEPQLNSISQEPLPPDQNANNEFEPQTEAEAGAEIGAEAETSFMKREIPEWRPQFR